MTTTKNIQIVIDHVHSEEVSKDCKSELEIEIKCNESLICRICMEGQLEDSNPILPLGCHCSQDLSHAHKNCLLKWFCLRRFTSTSREDGVSYKKCEICKGKLSSHVCLLIKKELHNQWELYLKKDIVNNIEHAHETRQPLEPNVNSGIFDRECVILGSVGILLIIAIVIILPSIFH